MYKLLKTFYGDFVIRTEENSVTTFPADQANADYQEYLKWVAAGNTPLPADGE
jgi:hypothetical protein